MNFLCFLLDGEMFVQQIGRVQSFTVIVMNTPEKKECVYIYICIYIYMYTYTVYLCRCMYIHTWNPNDPCFGAKRPCFEGLIGFQVCMHVYTYVYTYVWYLDMTYPRNRT